MTWFTISISTLIGAIIGIVYGWYFVRQQEWLFALRTQQISPSHKTLTIMTLASMVRIIVLAVVWFYILRSQSIDFILALISFIVLFWFMVLKKKVRSV